MSGNINFGASPQSGGPGGIGGETPIVLIKRGTRAQINAAATAGQLIAGQDYLITDEGRMAVGLSPTTYSAAAKQGEGGAVGGNVVIGSVAPTPSTGAKALWVQDLGGGNWTLNVVAGD